MTRIQSEPNSAGNETYAVNLIEALAEIDQSNRIHALRHQTVSDRSVRKSLAQLQGQANAAAHAARANSADAFRASCDGIRVDVLHVQYTAPPLAPCPVVATIHDLSFEHLPETFNRRSRTQLRLTVRRTARNAAQILTLSEFSRRDIIETYGIDPDRVAVTPAAASPHFRAGDK